MAITHGTKTEKTVIGLFENVMDASQAVNMLSENGYSREDLSILVSESSRDKQFDIKNTTKVAEGAAAGGAIGGAAAAIFGGLAAAGAVLAPGIGLLATGPLVAAFAAGGAGAAVGGVLGALVGLGIPEHEAKLYHQQIQGGGVLVGVDTLDESVNHVKDILKRAHAVNIQVKSK